MPQRNSLNVSKKYFVSRNSIAFFSLTTTFSKNNNILNILLSAPEMETQLEAVNVFSLNIVHIQNLCVLSD